MKYFPLVFALLAYSISLCQTTDFTLKSNSAKSSVDILDASGGDGTGQGGSIAFSIGQVFSNLNVNSNFSIQEGVQHPLPEAKIKPLPQPETEIHIAAYPNPVDDYFIIETTGLENKNISYKLFNLQGKLLAHNKLDRAGTKIRAHGLQASIYLINIIVEGRHIKTLKIIKR